MSSERGALQPNEVVCPYCRERRKKRTKCPCQEEE